MDALPIFLTLAGQQVIVVGDGEAAAAKARLVVAAGGETVDEAGNGRIAFVALDDEEAAAAAAARLRARGLLVNVVDRPAMSDFLMGAIVDRSPVVMAISTGGATASLSRALRSRLEALLPASLGPLAVAIREARVAAAAAHPTIAGRRRLWERSLAEGAILDPMRPLADPAAVVATAIAGSSAVLSDLSTIIVASTDPGELTLNQLAALGRCDTLVVIGDVPIAVIDRARRDAVRLTQVPPTLPEGLTIVLQASNSVSQ